MSEIRNYVAIRFSLRYPTWLQRAYGDEDNRAAWFAMRSKLFTTWTAPSLENQTVAPRRVFVLMDPSDVELWDTHLALPDPFQPVFCAADDADVTLSELIRADGDGPVLLARIDSDDAAVPTYLESLDETVAEAGAVGKPKAYVVACNGFISDLEKIQSVYWNFSPFFAVFIEEFVEAELFRVNHTKILALAPLLNTSALWLQVVHGSNLYNSMRFPQSGNPNNPNKFIAGPQLPVASAWPTGLLHLLDPRPKAEAPATPPGRGDGWRAAWRAVTSRF